MSLLYNTFSQMPLLDEKQVSHPLLSYLMKMLNAILIPDLNINGKDAKEQVFIGLEEIVTGLKRGDNVLLYPSGRICRGNLEVIGANSGAASVVHAVPEARIVLLRIRGLWGSQFSRASGVPSLLGDLKDLVLRVLANGVLFMPRREVHVEVLEPNNFPVNADRKEINRYLEDFYNLGPDRKTEVPWYWWQGGNPIYHDEARPEFVNRNTERIPDVTRNLVLTKLTELSGVQKIMESESLATDLGMDSLILAEEKAD
ncbi:MAG: hypothetical protein D3924_13600 [Candidatus Electrothrix sp. AR4]|nr:hypothetical protein [Candidatus Electrothrix sp. AR4]